MHPEILRTFERSEAMRKNLLEMVKPFSQTEKFFGHPDGKWSVSQILAHIVQAESLSLKYMKKKALGINDAGDTGVVEDLKFLILRVSQRLPLRYKAPAVLGESAPPSPDFDTVVNDWDAVRKDLLLFLQGIRPDHVKRKIYKHAVMGRLNVIQAVKFFDEHQIHHRPQIKRLLQ